MDIREEIRRGIEKRESWSKRIVVDERTLTRVRVHDGSLSITTTSRYGRVVRGNVITDWCERRWTAIGRIEYLYQILDIDILIRLLNINPAIAISFYKTERNGSMICCIIGSHCFYRKSSDHSFQVAPIEDGVIYLPSVIVTTIGRESIIRYHRDIVIEVETMRIVPSFSDIDLLIQI